MKTGEDIPIHAITDSLTCSSVEVGVLGSAVTGASMQ